MQVVDASDPGGKLAFGASFEVHLLRGTPGHLSWIEATCSRPSENEGPSTSRCHDLPVAPLFGLVRPHDPDPPRNMTRGFRRGGSVPLGPLRPRRYMSPP